MTKYYKVTNAKEKHHGYQYHDGLNILTEPFNDDTNDPCGGGFYFTSKKHISGYCRSGVNVREITLPINDPAFKMIRVGADDPTIGDVWRANQINLGKKYSLYDKETHKKFGSQKEV